MNKVFCILIFIAVECGCLMNDVSVIASFNGSYD